MQHGSLNWILEQKKNIIIETGEIGKSIVQLTVLYQC